MLWEQLKKKARRQKQKKQKKRKKITVLATLLRNRLKRPRV